MTAHCATCTCRTDAPHPPEGDDRRQLADALAPWGTNGDELDALMPVVERIARRRAATELRALEQEAMADPTRSIQRIAQERAAALAAPHQPATSTDGPEGAYQVPFRPKGGRP